MRIQKYLNNIAKSYNIADNDKNYEIRNFKYLE